MFHRFSRRLALTLGSSTPWVFLFGALAVGLITEGISKLVDASFSDNDLKPGLVTLLFGLLTLGAVFSFFDLPRLAQGWLSSLGGRKTDVIVTTDVPPRPGLVVLVSPGRHRAAEPALRYHFRGIHDERAEPMLKYAWLLAGPGEGMESSQANAKALKGVFEQYGVMVTIWELRDADDPKEIFRAVQDIYQEAADRYQLDPDNIIADFTGGTKCMTAGMVLACAARDWDLQYMKPSKYTPDGRAAPDAESLPRLVNVDFFVSSDKP